LQRMQRDETTALSVEQRAELGRTVGQLQQRYFDRAPESGAPPDLQPVLDRWLGEWRRATGDGIGDRMGNGNGRTGAANAD
jgi:hypothetical protein